MINPIQSNIPPRYIADHYPSALIHTAIILQRIKVDMMRRPASLELVLPLKHPS